MIRLERIDWDDPRAEALRAAMDAESGGVYREEYGALSEPDRQAFSDALGVHTEDVVATLLALDDNGTPVGHAGLKRLTGDLSDALEVKKVVVDRDHRGKGISRALMVELEAIARQEGARRLVLQTGFKQAPAIGLYESLGYTPIPAYGGYDVLPASIFYGKSLD